MTFSRRSIVDVSLLGLVNALWAAQYPAYKVASEKMGPITLSAWTFLIAAIVLLPFLVWELIQARTQGHSNGPSTLNTGLAEPSRLNTRNAIGFLMVGIVGLVPASALLAWGINLSSASDAALIYLTVPIMTALLASLILQEKMTLFRWASLFLSLLGVLILSDVDWRHLKIVNTKFLLGNVLVLAACASSSFYNVYCKELLRRFSPMEILVYGYLLALALSVPLMIWLEDFSLFVIRTYQPTTWLALLVLSVLSWGLAMVLWMFLLKRLDVSQASVSIYLLPFLGVLISAVTLHENITGTMIVGGLVTLTGTVLITTAEPSKV
jgi:drug/metabolite transporter (DMT)-like permease